MPQKCSTSYCRNNKNGSCTKPDSELSELTKSGAGLGGNKCPGFKSKLP